MMSAATSATVFSFNLAQDALALEPLYRLRAEVQSSAQNRDAFRAVVESIPDAGADAVRRGIGYWVLGRNADTVETLNHAKGNFADFFRAKALLANGEAPVAFVIFEKLRADDHVGTASRFSELECHVARAEWDTLAKALKSFPKSLAETADYHYFQGCLANAQGRHENAIVSFERALEIHPEHRRAMFHLAYSLDLYGMDDEAREIYEKLVQLPPVDIAAVMNLGILYEDRNEYPRAIACFDAVLRSDPHNLKARLYKNDCEASLTMFYDETQERKDDKLQQTLRVPITDFELSVRARNCLTKMNIKSLGDLVRKSESELLSYKNFGETSLNEIKAILGSKNLGLGMLPPEKITQPPPEMGSVDPNLYSKPILELDLSVRSRRTMEALAIRSVGDLLQHSAEELLAMPNFGQTSLNEIRMKLRALGVDLRDTKGGPIKTFTPIPLPTSKKNELDAELMDDDELFDEIDEAALPEEPIEPDAEPDLEGDDGSDGGADGGADDGGVDEV
ncbi:MAG: tetratricopeptide repeat protein [Planctomycetes bacterium]|nr:tetratricopeptide repeat protein [Planctomycetota bacterium]